MRFALVGTLFLVGLVAATVALITLRQRAAERDIAESRAIAATADIELSLDPQLGLLLAIQAADKARTAEATDALRHALLQLHEQLTLPQPADEMTFSQDGLSILTLDSDFSSYVRLWDARTGQQRARIGGGDSVSAALSPSGRLIATADMANNAQVWTARGRLLAERVGQGSRESSDEGAVVGDAPFGRGDRTIVTSDGANTATIWQPATGRPHALLHAQNAISGARFSPNGRYVAATTTVTKNVITATSNGSSEGATATEVWDARSGRRVAALSGDTPRFSPNGRWLSTFAGGHVDIWEVPRWDRVASLMGDSATFTRDGRYIVTTSTSGVRVFAAAGWRRTARPPAGLRLIAEPGFSPDGRFALIGDHLVSVATGEKVADVVIHAATQSKGPGAEPAFSPDGASLISTDDTGVHMWATPDWHAAWLSPSASQVFAVAASGDHLVAAASDGPGIARVWKAPLAAPGAPARPLGGPRIRAVAMTLSHGGQYVAGVTRRGDVAVWRVSPWQLVGRLPNIAGRVSPSSPPLIAVSQDGGLVGITAGLSTSIWDVASGHRLASRSQSSFGSGDKLIISQDGRLAASSADQNTEIWESHTGRLVATLRSSANNVTPAAFSRDDTRVVTVSDDKTARVWDARSGKPIAVLRGHTDTVTSAALSADDRFVVTASWDGTVRVWDADSGRAVATLPVRATTDTTVAFSATGHTVVVAGNGVVHTVACEVCRPFRQLLDLAKRRALRTLTPQERRDFLHT